MEGLVPDHTPYILNCQNNNSLNCEVAMLDGEHISVDWCGTSDELMAVDGSDVDLIPTRWVAVVFDVDIYQLWS
jgi:hypothetical protein